MLKVQSVSGQIANAALLGDLIPLLCDEIVKEYREVLARPTFKFYESQCGAAAVPLSNTNKLEMAERN